MDDDSLRDKITELIRAANQAGTKPNALDLANQLDLDLPTIQRALRAPIDDGIIDAERKMAGGDGYWASGLTIAG